MVERKARRLPPPAKEKNRRGRQPPRADPGAQGTEAPRIDTSTDWDQWMERHGQRPPSRADVADEKGRFPRKR